MGSRANFGRRALAALLLFVVERAWASDFVNFESGHVRPLALAPAGDLLFAVHTPDNRLAIYRVGDTDLALAAEVAVGLEPTAVAARVGTNGALEAWVVNHLSDSVSVVAVDPLDPTRSRVTHTLLVGDEPRDIVFAGSGGSRAFVTAARRGQNRFPGEEADGPQLTAEGVGRADVWVFATDAPGTDPLAIVQLFGDSPGALAAAPDGSRVYASVFHSGNRTTAINESSRASVGPLPPPPPGGRLDGPSTGLIVALDPASGSWRDEAGTDWSAAVSFTLPDWDVFVLDANSQPPGQPTAPGAIAGIGTTIFGLLVNPTTGKLYATNTDARNRVRFVGPPDATHGLTGHLISNRVSVIDDAAGVVPVHLNPHIDYGVLPGPAAEIERSLAIPIGMATTGDGARLFVTAFGSAKLGVFDTTDLEAGVVTQLQVPVGEGPSGVVHDAMRDRLYVVNSLSHSISIVAGASTPSPGVIATVDLPFDPSPPVVTRGRRFLYDARRSAHGDASCASCHVFGDADGLAWDLGDPFGTDQPNPNPFRLPEAGQGMPFHPMKGPMMTQTLRGLAGAGPMHWRGDRTGGLEPGGDPLDEVAAFKAFNQAFVDLLGAAAELDDADMQDFADFALTLRHPPNPIRRLDDSLTYEQARGADLYHSGDGGRVQACVVCHREAIATDGFSSVDGVPQEFKIPHLRSLYQKVGMFGVPPDTLGVPPTGFLGDQIRGFGFLHDGGLATIFDGLKMIVDLADTDRRQLEAFLAAFDSGLKPIVGQQITAASANLGDAEAGARIDLLVARAEAGDCDLVVTGALDGEGRSWLYDATARTMRGDRVGEAPLSETDLRAQAATPGLERTYTCVPPGSGVRIGLDRDRDGALNRTEIDAGSNPSDPDSAPLLPGSTVRIRSSLFRLRDGAAAPRTRRLLFRSISRADPRAHRIAPPLPGSSGDPTIHGATLRIQNTSGSGEALLVPLPASGWSATRGQAQHGYRFRGVQHPISHVRLEPGRLLVRGRGEGLDYSLDEDAQGSVALTLSIGTDWRWCAEAGRSPHLAVVDVRGRFSGKRHSPPPPRCP